MPRIKMDFNKGRRSTTFSIPAPIKGLYDATMGGNSPPDSAIVLDNFYPERTHIRVRNGGRNLISSSNIGEKPVVSSHGDFFAGSATIDTITTQFTTAAGEFTYRVSGGTTAYKLASAASWTVPTTTPAYPLNDDIIYAEYVFSSRNRLFFLGETSSKVAYFDNGAIQGNIGFLELGGFMPKGGSLIAGTTWTLDTGAGMDDMTVFLTSAGQALVFSGNNPSSATDWALKGVYDIGVPIGKRCLTRFGGDILILTTEGVFSLGSFVNNASSLEYNLTSQISGIFKKEYIESTATFLPNGDPLHGWQIIYWQTGGQLLINIPKSATTSTQLVMNTATRAWCRYTGINALNFALTNYNNPIVFVNSPMIYVTGGGHILHYTDGQPAAPTYDYPNSAIVAKVSTSYQNFGNNNFKIFNQLSVDAIMPNGNVWADVSTDFYAIEPVLKTPINYTSSHKIYSPTETIRRKPSPFGVMASGCDASINFMASVGRCNIYGFTLRAEIGAEAS